MDATTQPTKTQPIDRIKHLEHLVADLFKVPVDELEKIAKELIDKANKKTETQPVTAPASNATNLDDSTTSAKSETPTVVN